jgi:hypothetical protein
MLAIAITMPTEQEQLNQLLKEFNQQYPSLAQLVSTPLVEFRTLMPTISAEVIDGVNTTGNGLTYLGSRTGRDSG